MTEFDTFTEAYAVTALWSSVDAFGEDNEGPIVEDPHDLSILALSTVLAFRRDCDAFRETAGSILDRWAPITVAHNFWLTRNRHGAGFWDGDYPEPDATILTDLSHGYGECELYVGDDGLIYVYGEEISE